MIKWKLEKWQIEDLKPYDGNPRSFTEKGLKDLNQSLDNIGFAQPINITIDGVVLSGNARLVLLKKRGEKEVDVYVANRELTKKEQQEVVIRMNANTAGEWDAELLESGFDEDDLEGWGLDDVEWLESEPDYNNEEIDISSLNQEAVLKLQFSQSVYLKVLDALATLKFEGKTNEQVILELLNVQL